MPFRPWRIRIARSRGNEFVSPSSAGTGPKRRWPRGPRRDRAPPYHRRHRCAEHGIGSAPCCRRFPSSRSWPSPSIGQHLVILQRGLDLSVAGMMSLCRGDGYRAAAGVGGRHGRRCSVGIALAIGSGILAGPINGPWSPSCRFPPWSRRSAAARCFSASPLFVSRQHAKQVAASLSQFALGQVRRRFPTRSTSWRSSSRARCSSSDAPRSAAASSRSASIPRRRMRSAIPVELYRIGTYMRPGSATPAAGVMLAGFLSSPTVFCGNPYCWRPRRRSWSAAIRSAAAPGAA